MKLIFILWCLTGYALDVAASKTEGSRPDFLQSLSPPTNQTCSVALLSNNCGVFMPKAESPFSPPNIIWVSTYTEWDVRKDLFKALKNDNSLSDGMKLKLTDLAVVWSQSEAILFKDGKFQFNPEVNGGLLEGQWPEHRLKNSPLVEVQTDKAIQLLNSLNPSFRKVLASYTRRHPRKSAQEPEDPKATAQERIKQKNRLQKLAQQAKDIMVKTILNGRTRDQVTPNILNTILKLESVQINLEASTGNEKTSGCHRSELNAAYSPLDNQVSICPAYLSLPDSALIEVIGHELGHSIDPCELTFGLYKQDFKALEFFEKAQPSALGITKNQQNDFLAKIKAYVSEIGSQSGRNLADFLTPEELEIYKKNPIFKLAIPGVPSAEYPFAQAMQCLSEKSKIRVLAADDVAKFIQTIALDGEKKTGKKTPQKELDEVRAKLLVAPSCARTLEGKSEAAEAMSDMWGATVLAELLKNEPPKNNQDRLNIFAQGLGSGEYCSEIRNDQKTSQQPSPLDKIKKYKEISDRVFDPHPYYRIRFDEIILSHPDIAKALGCQPNTKTNCHSFMQKPSSSGIQNPEKQNNKEQSKPGSGFK